MVEKGEIRREMREKWEREKGREMGERGREMGER